MAARKYAFYLHPDLKCSIRVLFWKQGLPLDVAVTTSGFDSGGVGECGYLSIY